MVLIPPPPSKASATQGNCRSRSHNPREWQRDAHRQSQGGPANKQRASFQVANSKQKRVVPARAAAKYKSPPEADLDHLWKIVRKFNRAQTMSKQPNYRQATKSSEGKRRGAGSVTASGSIKTTSSTQRDYLKATDAEFRDEIWKGYGIRIMEHDIPYAEPYQHFKTHEPDSKSPLSIMEWYQKSHEDCSIWLTLDEAESTRIAQQYKYLGTIEANEAKYAHRGRTHFFKDDDQIIGSKTRDRKSFFELEWGPRPNNAKKLYCPPQNQDPTRSLTFDTNPDCTYWLTLQRLSKVYRSGVEKYTFVHRPAQVAAPYLTIEFKKARTTLEEAVNQLAITIPLVLFNRLILRCRRLQSRSGKSQQWPNEEFDGIKHYGIALSGSEAHIFIAQPCLDFNKFQTIDGVQHPWVGCQLNLLNIYDVEDAEDVASFSAWVNEIHNWGLGDHSRQFELDVKGIVYQTIEDKSRVSLTSSDMEALRITDDSADGTGHHI